MKNETQSVDINPLLSFSIWLVDFYEIATPAKLFYDFMLKRI